MAITIMNANYTSNYMTKHIVTIICGNVLNILILSAHILTLRGPGRAMTINAVEL